MKFGRLPRGYDPRIPHWSALTAGRAQVAPPAACDYTTTLPSTGLGMFSNDSLGDCTCAEPYHALQVWSAAATPPVDTEPDNNAVLLYEQSCGYVPGNPATDQGGIIQNVLTYWLNTGIPLGADGSQRQQLVGFVEVDQRNLMDVKLALYQSGALDIGFLVPNYLPESPGALWDYTPGQPYSIIDGHSVAVAGYDDVLQRFTVLSWGAKYYLSYAFWAQFVDEVYMLANKRWIEATGFTPAGQTLPQLQELMSALQWNNGASRWRRRRRRRAKRWKHSQEAAS